MEHEFVKEGENPIFYKYYKDTGDFNKAADLSSEWYKAHGGPTNVLNTNNYHEAELERERLEYRIKRHNLNRDDFKKKFDYYDELIERLKWEEAENPKLTLEDLICRLNAVADRYDRKGLYYEDPDFFNEIERRRKEKLESVFKFGKYTDLDYGDPMITHVLAKAFMKRIENGEITSKDLLKFLEDC